MNLPYDIKIAPAAQRQVSAFPAKQQKNILKVLEALAVNPRPPGSKKIEGMTGLYCEEMDHLRIVYKVEDQEVLILLIK